MGYFWLFRLFAKHDLDDNRRSDAQGARDGHESSTSRGNSQIHQTDAALADMSIRSSDTPSPTASAASASTIATPTATSATPGTIQKYNVACISSEIRRGPNGRSRFTVFRVLVNYDSEQWWLFKRYSDFRALHALLRKELPPRHGLPSLPARRLFGDNYAKSFLAKRRAGLHAYLLGVVDDATVRRSKVLLDFLDDGRHVLYHALGIPTSHPRSVPSQLSMSTASTVRSLGAIMGMKRVTSSSVNKSTSTILVSATKTPVAVARAKPRAGSRSRAGSLASVRKGEMRRLAPAAPVRSSRSQSVVTNEDGVTRPASSTTASSALTTVKSRFPSQRRKMGLDDFLLLSVIGKGSYGKVMLARHKSTGGVYAIKAIAKSRLRGKPADIRRVMSEREVLRRNATHPFLIGLRYSFQSAQKLYLCVDYVSGGELFFHLQRERRFPEARTRFYACEILSALAFLHELGYVYRDLKPENLLLDSEGHIRLVDFGLAKNTGEGTTSTFCGTPEYLAPEVLRQQRYGKTVDWYCFGSVLFEMLTGLPPFYSPNDKEMFDRILHGQLRFTGNVSKAARVLITGLLERNPLLRLGSRGADEVKRQAFFRGIDWDRVYRKEYPVPFDPQVTGTMDLHNIDPKFCEESIPNSLLGEVAGKNYLKEAKDADGQDFDETFNEKNRKNPQASNIIDDDEMEEVELVAVGNNDVNEIDPRGDEWDETVDRMMSKGVSEAEIERQVDTAFVGFSYAPEGVLGGSYPTSDC